ncbi:hypothetical protein JXA48_01560, partial [Candidatus Woesearchaeota archaeon]|nr:hypothetical protein [Candidatus Woesearchaeota archaeon]
ETCDGQYNLEYYKNLPLFLEKTSNLCYQVFDLANNNIKGTKKITVPMFCFNGIEDPFEKGVDCGGSCPANCGTCNNNKQDAFELGVDCGGVCATMRSCENEGKINDSAKGVDSNEAKSCVLDSDCGGMNEFCIAGKCTVKQIKEKDPNENTYVDENNFNILGLILLILGLLMMGGGGYYIYYSEMQRAEYLKKQQAYQQQKQQSPQITAEQLARQKRIQEERIKALKEKQAKGLEQRDKKVQERKSQRSSLLGAFGSEEETEEKVGQTTESPFDNVKPVLKKQEEIIDSNTDDGYLDLTEVNAGSSSNSAFDKLGKLVKGEKPSVEEKPVLKSENKTDLTANLPKPKNSFEALQQFINATHNQQQKPSNFEHMQHIEENVSSDDFIDAFTHEVEADHLDETTLVSLLKVLIKEQKINLETAKEILEKLEQENFIPKNNIEKLFSKINN